MPNPNHTIAYLSLEIGLDGSIPTYSGGLGVLAGDTIRAAADLELPYAAVTLLYRDGYFTQSLDASGMQREGPTPWDPETRLEQLPHRVYVPIEGRTVYVRAYRLYVEGVTGHRVPVYFLDTDLPENEPGDRTITRALYAGDPDHRIRQEAVLGIAGRRMLRAATHDCTCFHMNEGHGCFLTVELMSEFLSRHQTFDVTAAAIEYVRRQCVFTTHTPVEAGHDRFGIDRVRAIIGDHPAFSRPELCGGADVLNTTKLALNLSRHSNGVARKHGEVSRAMFPGYDIGSVTNGVHAGTWTGPRMAALFDERVPGWRACNSDLRLAHSIEPEAIRHAHGLAKDDLLDEIDRLVGVRLDPDRFTVGFARRMTAYKRPHLLLSDHVRLEALAKAHGPIQIVYAGKAHPHDHQGKEILASIHAVGAEMGEHVRVVVVPDYGMDLAKFLVAGVDLWLNTPKPPMEASGTSGMKAALNGVPQLSTLDGWWLEGCIEGVTGWGIHGEASDDDALARLHAQSLYDTLEQRVLPTYTGDPERWAKIMRHAIVLNGSHFTTERMVRDYVHQAYLY